MAEDPRFLLHFKTLAKFNEKLADGTINEDRHLCFIKDAGLVWCRGTYYADSTKLNGIASIYNGWSITLSNASTLTITLTGLLWNSSSRTWTAISKALNINAATLGVAGLLSAADKTKLDGLNTNNVSNISFSSNASNVVMTVTKDNGNSSDTSTASNMPVASSSVAGIMTAADKVKLDTTLPGLISSEATTRALADTNLLNQINSINNNTVKSVTKSGTGAVITNGSITGTVLTLASGNYTFGNGSSGNFTVTPPGKSAQTVSIGKPSNAGYADSAGAVAWAGVSGKPALATRWPSWSEVTSKPTTFTPSAHNHSWSNITSGVPAYCTRWPSWSEVTGKPSTFAPSSHTHTAAQVSGLAAVAKSGSYNDLSNKPSIPSYSAGTGISISGSTISVASNVMRTDAASTMSAALYFDSVAVDRSGTTGTMCFYYNNSHVHITPDGLSTFDNSVAADGGFFDTSDERVKENVKPIDTTNADKLRLVEFDRTDREHHGYGVIAQEIEPYYPDIVQTDDTGFKTVNYNEIYAIKIKALEDKIAKLESIIELLAKLL